MTKIKTVPFDAADYINTPEDVATFLQAAFDEAFEAIAEQTHIALVR